MAIFRRRAASRRDAGMTPLKAGILTLVLLGVLTYFGFTRANPFSNPYELHALFRDARNLQTRSAVRISGVDVGKVTKVEPVAGDEPAAEVTMELNNDALPIHRDAELKVRPRIFLEGNYFVDLSPGTPSAPDLKDGSTIPDDQTASSVSLSDILSVLPTDVRSDLKSTLHEFGTRGLVAGGARAFNRAAPFFEPAYRNSALTNDALLGTQPRSDVRRLLQGQQRAFAALSADPTALADLVTNLNATAGALASEDTSLRASIPALRDTLRTGDPALAELNRTLPTLRVFAREALPGVRSSSPTLDAAIPWIRQARLLMTRDELRGLASDLRRATPSLVQLNERFVPLLGQLRELGSCTNRVLVPFSETRIPAVEPNNTNQEARRQILRSFVGLAGESRLNDANSPHFHIQGVSPGALYPVPLPPPIGTPGAGKIEPLAPSNPNTPPPHRPDVPCETQQPPNLDAPDGPGIGPALSASKTRRLQADLRSLLSRDRFARLVERVRAGKQAAR